MITGIGTSSVALAVRKIAVPGAIVQISAATAMGAGTALWWGWPVGEAVVFGLALSVASTVVLLRALEAKGLLDSTNGRIAVGWLVVEDLAMVLVLVLLPPLAELLNAPADAAASASTSGSLAGTLLTTLATYSNLNASTSYVQRSFSLLAYKGQTVRLNFNCTEGSTLQTSFVIDDVSLLTR